MTGRGRVGLKKKSVYADMVKDMNAEEKKEYYDKMYKERTAKMDENSKKKKASRTRSSSTKEKKTKPSKKDSNGCYSVKAHTRCS